MVSFETFPSCPLVLAWLTERDSWKMLWGSTEVLEQRGVPHKSVMKREGILPLHNSLQMCVTYAFDEKDALSPYE